VEKLEHIYNFTAFYEDGSIIEQNEEDKSELLEGKSRFYDVLEKEKESKLISFVLHNDEFQIGVDLRDGHFEMNGIPFFQHRPDLQNYEDFRIIYYRTVKHGMNSEGQIIASEILGYSIGWQTTYEGTNVKKEIFL
jgi:hypothetical protein